MDILFVGEPAGQSEEATGKPFTSPLYSIVMVAAEGLLETMPDLQMRFTHGLLCRPCSAMVDAESNPVLDHRTKLPIWRDSDQPPIDAMHLCKERLHEEVYLCDPRLIVALGPMATYALFGKKINEANRGGLFTLEIAGETDIPRLNAKGEWGRKRHGQMLYPTDTFQVRYPVFMTGRLAHVRTYGASEDPDREREVFIRDIKQIRDMLCMFRKLGT